MAKRAGQRQTKATATERSMAVAYVNIAVAIAALEHQVERLTAAVQLLAPEHDWRRPRRKR